MRCARVRCFPFPIIFLRSRLPRNFLFLMKKLWSYSWKICCKLFSFHQKNTFSNKALFKFLHKRLQSAFLKILGNFFSLSRAYLFPENFNFVFNKILASSFNDSHWNKSAEKTFPSVFRLREASEFFHSLRQCCNCRFSSRMALISHQGTCEKNFLYYPEKLLPAKLVGNLSKKFFHWI